MTSMNSGHIATNSSESSVSPANDSCKTDDDIESIRPICAGIPFQTAKILEISLRSGIPDDFPLPLSSRSSAKDDEINFLVMHHTLLGDLKRRRRHVTFGLVDLYHFDRLQGFACVPSQGGSTLGMASEHWSKEQVSVIEHQSRRKYQRYSALLRFCLEGKLLLSFQQFRMLESRVKCQQRLLTRKNEAGQCSNILRNVDSRCLKRPVGSIENPSDDDLSFLDSLEEYYFLQPLSVKRRRVLLRKAGLHKIDPAEKHECEAIRKSRSKCGCTCPTGMCDPRTCECALNGIPCQVDRARFPCACLSPSHCSNPEGRIEFNPVRVRTHYLHTRMRLESEEREAATATNASVPTKRSRLLEVAVPPKSRDACAAQFFGEDVGECQVLPSSSHVLKLGTSRSVEEALNATASNGGCQDCQNDRYVHLLVQELQCQQRLQNGFETEEEEEEGEGEGTVESSQRMLSDNLTVNSASFPHDTGNVEAVCGEGSFIQSSPRMSQIAEQLNTVLLNTVSCDDVGEDNEDDDEEDDDEEDDGDDCDSVVLPDQCSTSELGRAALRPPLVEPLTSGMSDANSLKETTSSPSFCRLDPIASLFRGPHEITGTGPEVGREEGTNASSISSRRPPSVCEVVIA
ncbi:Cysteine/serine-rich nuclear protein 2 [Echinococcus granulosus]|uniref:Cysteine:serine rich nuclear protein 3 n=1 Tax=Echinococcus granulosus TaxID=6210 RepID=A0A068WIA3_ECHGR|nr:Cysteine/serine-rich nuclear protein 2 [Echinococcus granulosus]CDS17410.1 cysteine:serine rich nuclear protein 3 [Echinococcus granulosus]